MVAAPGNIFSCFILLIPKPGYLSIKQDSFMTMNNSGMPVASSPYFCSFFPHMEDWGGGSWGAIHISTFHRINDSFIHLFILPFIHLHGKLVFAVCRFRFCYPSSCPGRRRQFSYFLLGLRVNNLSNCFFLLCCVVLLMSIPCLCISIILFLLPHQFMFSCVSLGFQACPSDSF